MKRADLHILMRLLLAAFLMITVAACDRALVYGETAGVNIGISSDAARATPIDVNIGLERQVVSITPGKKEPGQDARARGEATSVLSNFSLATTSGGTEGLSDTTVIGTTFVSGAAAVTLVKSNQNAEAVAERVLGATVRGRVSDAPEVRSEQQALIRYINASEANLERYLAFARGNGLEVPNGQTERASAIGSITSPANTQRNRQFLGSLN